MSGFGSVDKKPLPSGRYRARYVHDGRRFAAGTYPNKTLARQALTRIELSILNGTWIDPDAPEPESAPTFAEAFAAYVEYRVRLGKLREQTADDYRGVAVRWLGCGDPPTGFGAKPIDSITTTDCDRIVADSIEHGHKPGTTKNIVRVLNAVMRFAVRKRQWIDRNPAEGLEVPEAHVNADDGEGDDASDHTMMCLTGLEVMQLADAFDHLPYRTLIRLTVFGGGLRAGEVEGLRVRDFDPDARTITVARRIRLGKADRPKSDTSRRVNHLPDWLADEVAALCDGRPPEEPMFLTPSGAPYEHSRFYKPVFKPAVVRAGLPEGMRFHDLRHTAASLLLADGVPVVNVAKFLGHANPQVTLTVYAHVIPNQADRPARAFDGVADEYAAASRPLKAVS